MISKKMKKCVEGGSAIRAMFEDGILLAKQFGPENVYDFSLGNPNVVPPKEVKQAFIDILDNESPTLVHGYMNNAGYEDIRQSIANYINAEHHTNFTSANILMTVGAAGGINVTFKTLVNPGDEVVVFAPYFGEYKNYCDNYDAKLVVVPANPPEFQPDMGALEKVITERTKIVIINSPNNPTGVIYSEETISRLAKTLDAKQKEFGTSIYVISDEPYRELVYDGVQVPYVTRYYKNTIVGYSFSKTLSLPGERIGYLVLPNELDDFANIVMAASTANRILGFVNAPSILQRVVAKCLGKTADFDVYVKNRDVLYTQLPKMGYECVRPDGGFYLFIKSPVEDETVFCKAAKEERVLLVPGSAFGCPGYVRLAYCVAHETIEKALPQLKKIMEKME